MAPVITFYGDDFTGSSAVMEVLAFAGIPSIMFLDIPSPAMLARIEGMAAIGIAGISRSKPPEWMDAELPRVFAALARLGAPILHYKTCSTFDSAPYLGSIGRAIELGMAATGASFVPLVVGAPAIGRYQMFGNLFAALDGVGYRLDRHPVMARHPATPMHEADLCRHLEGQTALPSAVVDWRALMAGQGADALRAARADGARIIALDLFDEPTLERVGAILWEEARQAPLYAVGSQGIEYALVAHFRQTGRLPRAIPPASFGPAEPLLVVSGSCSETTARQIAAAGGAGFRLLLLDAARAVDPEGWPAELARIEQAMLETLASGTSLVVATARGPADPAIARFRERLETSGVPPGPVHDRIGQGLGRLVRTARLKTGLSRAIFAGGDTSGHAMLALGAEALEPLAPLAAGAPLLRVRSTDPVIDGLEVALKGGQMGDETVFVRAARGRAQA
ncbi:MAG: four-carbon acid sugar kinase family protein [Beijerinckiaceae bacterium]|nr:four-carbon acid sugar kinase family protein [Beijerinckiaceae bacterium]MCZ8300178.1 four-carbon acid sugar kinase family protein [Beijerinckiaceae bacterium]